MAPFLPDFYGEYNGSIEPNSFYRGMYKIAAYAFYVHHFKSHNSDLCRRFSRKITSKNLSKQTNNRSNFPNELRN